jgi:glycosyltransferase involved in cell wall biosynthesis
MSMSKLRPSISIFFPFLNDWGTAGSLIALASATVSQLTDDWEIIIIDDGSTPENRKAIDDIVKAMKGAEKQIRVIHHEKNSGYGGALIRGFKEAKKELVFYTDGDAQYDPREVRLLYERMTPNIDMVNGYKIRRNDPWYRIVMGRLYHLFVKMAFRLPIRDTDCDFRLIRRSVFEKVMLFETTGTICTELVKKIDHFGFNIVEVPVHHFWRTSGKSQFFNMRRLAKTATNLGNLWWKLMIRKEYMH